MFRSVLFLFALLAGGAAQMVEIGGSLSYVRLDHGVDDYWRGALNIGYQFNSLSDELMLTLISDREADEAQLSYAFVMASLSDYSPFNSLPFVRASIGLGNTYARTNTLTHLSYGVGIGAYAMLTDRLRARFAMDYTIREWQIDRSGNEPDIEAWTRKDKELQFSIGFGVMF
ncbi:MAG: hypothetical protein LBT81_04890 [Helicobacteraceae bacterium]|nr:hypothetical protein [Helicobacteraceae bacterium]